MRIGKPNSKRTPVRLRHRIQKASASKERKRKKEAKKNPEWRSRLKKDPGIPNLFPYKGRVLAEIEEGKRRKEEEAQRRRDLAKAQRQGKQAEVNPTSTSTTPISRDLDVLSDGGEEDDNEDVDEDESMDENEDSNPMAALLASAQARADTYVNDTRDHPSEDEAEEEWNGIDDTNPTIASAQVKQKGLPKQVLADPIKSIAKLLERVQDSSGGISILLDHYQLPPLVTTGSDLPSRFLVEVARKRGRLGRGGIPNLHSAALTVLGDLNDERLVLPVVKKETIMTTKKGEVKVVETMAEAFRIEGLWDDDAGGVAV